MTSKVVIVTACNLQVAIADGSLHMLATDASFHADDNNYYPRIGNTV